MKLLMVVVTVHNAKTQLSRLIARAEAGEEIVIARGAQPVVRLVPFAEKPPIPQPGFLKGEAQVPDAFFFDPLTEEELRLWEGTDEDPAR